MSDRTIKFKKGDRVKITEGENKDVIANVNQSFVEVGGTITYELHKAGVRIIGRFPACMLEHMPLNMTELLERVEKNNPNWAIDLLDWLFAANEYDYPFTKEEHMEIITTGWVERRGY